MNPSDAGGQGPNGNPRFPPPPRGRVSVGRFLLEIGAPAGTAVVDADDGEDAADIRLLQRALKDDKGGSSEPRIGGVADTASALVDEASDMTSKLEHAVGLFSQLAARRLDPKALSSEIPFLLDLLERLDREGRWSEALDLARALSSLLALLMRWVELVRSLRTALAAAEKLGDRPAMGWAVHELGTLHLGAERASAAERRLSQAQEIRRLIDDRAGLAVTEQNLQALCRVTHRLLRERRLVQRTGRFERLWYSRALAIAAAVALLAGGAIAGAAIWGTEGQGNASGGGDGAAAEREGGGPAEGGDEGTNGAGAPGADDELADADGDGVSPPDDCDDGNASVFPGAEEIVADGVDQDCDGVDAADGGDATVE